jgi:hypothetical protein
VDRDYQEALSLERSRRRRACRGDEGCGLHVRNGFGVDKDLQQAIAWYRKAAALGDEVAKENLRLLGENP